MLPYPHIDPVLIRVGPVAVRWYGLMYLVGFLAGYGLVRKQLGEEGEEVPAREVPHLDGILLSVILGVVLGGRLGYVAFYNLDYYLHNPSEIIATWHGGMSFHGGALGACVGGWIYTRRHGLDFWKWADRFVVTAPVGLGLGRIGNFINGELFGRQSDVPWAMVFPQGGTIPRHPSQLYEALLEGVVLFCVLWPLRHRPWPHGRKLALFLVLYSVSRFFVEFFREPDPQVGFVALGWMTMGQVLSIAGALLGAGLWVFLPRRASFHCAR